MQSVKIKSALISVYYKDRLEPLVELLKQHNVTIYSTGGTQAFLEEQGAEVVAVEDLTSYPSIFGGRVKTLHPKVFGGILHRRDNTSDLSEREQYEIPAIDLVIVDLYPFEETVASGASEADVIEKIDIGGISLIRAAAKNFKDVLIVSSREQYDEVVELLQAKDGSTDLEDRKRFAAKAFDVSSHYDTHIFNYLNSEEQVFKQSVREATPLRYGENPHQQGTFYGKLEDLFEQLNGKQLSYNNLVDVDAAVMLGAEFEEPAVAILKHTNACGCATADTIKEAYLLALSSDPVSAFGGVIIANRTIDLGTAEELNKLFFEVLIAPEYDAEALELLRSKKNRILLKQKPVELPKKLFKTLLNGVIEQDKDLKTETEADFTTVTKREPTAEEKKALVFAAKVCKHTKSNTIVLATDKMMFSSGVGQTSRVDALRQSIEKAKSFGFDVSQTVMASDAFFPFPDCVEIADQAGIKAVVQPGGSIKDKDSIEYCDAHNMAMVMTGIRHFKH
ncbi:bifunctional phosphoribosylaminoimidazolecarboxamide formyltransferase/IMP cyclohydrolase [Pontibacter sp. SGAir0037]|uniref:bifunctional phosphoribosylaminoimidazolecarboxamide formyltransferase/IMP cyclohydrolase n=1 Tax=Pontibacter sp. SGAir0037 TaxID=2571030 RepID=UPI0010CCB84E|nr:bifunctional phosphoribosylaminoimidazolecarboxamide formyltransferase/IMP cyclohydrolase [Pontibacter sp. SGAir0037]QCR23691.1 bifunctional phosphoribosylaminoimidazolecarboxamide formyltransferase/IMP cyclohydrolase PurH [Pontibacter sp. SGAir0037]